MKTVAFFNNKGGVGKTTLVYHLAHMLPRIGFPTVALDLDPQANLTSAFFSEEEVEEIWEEQDSSITRCISPILEGTGDIEDVEPTAISDGLWILAGDLGLSRFEDALSEKWPGGFTGRPDAMRATSSFYRIARNMANRTGSEVVLFDVGPNLGAINRAALLAADCMVVPLAADLFSLQGLRNLGPQLLEWRDNWRDMLAKTKVEIPLPSGTIRPLGYVILQHAVRLDRPTRAYERWAQRIPTAYREYVLDLSEPGAPPHDADPLCLASLKNYRSLMPMAQSARKPIFDLKAADGAIGAHSYLTQDAYRDFEALAKRLVGAVNIAD